MIAQAVRRLFGSGSSVPSIANADFPYSFDNPKLDLRDPGVWEAMFGGGGRSAAGVRVTQKDLLTFAPLMRAALILSGDTACSPLHVCWDRVQPGDDTIDENHPADRIVSAEWNPHVSAAAGWARTIQERCIFGSAYVYVERDHRDFTDDRSRNWGTVTGLYHLSPVATKRCQATETCYLGSPQTGYLYVEEGEVYYETTIGNQTVFLACNEVLEFHHFPAYKLPIINLMRDVVGLALAARGFQSKFFANGAQAGGFIQLPADTSPKSAENLQRELTKVTDSNNWFRVHLLRDGATFQKLTVDPKSADMHDIDERAARRVADYFNINPSKMGLPGSDSYGAGESARVDHVTGTMHHIFVQIQGECYIKLFSPRQRKQTGSKSRCFRHDYSRLAEPDAKTQTEIEILLRNAAIVNANDVLQRLGRRTRTDEQAFEYFNPSTAAKDLNQPDDQTADDSTTDPATDNQGDDDATSDTEDNGRRWAAAILPRIREAGYRIVAASDSRIRKAETFEELCRSQFADYRHLFRTEVEPVIALRDDVPAERLTTAEDRFHHAFSHAVARRVPELKQQNTTAQRRRIMREAAQETFDDHGGKIVELLTSSTS